MSDKQTPTPASPQSGFSRRGLLGAASTSLILATLGVTTIAQFEAEAASLSSNDRDILNFALNLEYLEAEFYLFATTGVGLTQADTDGAGTEGATMGGAEVGFSDATLRATAEELARDETAHVRFLRMVLGRHAVGKPAINLNALGLGFANETEFLILARAFEDVGVSAYGGAAPLLTPTRRSPTLAAAARILATEAYHAGNIRLQVVQRGIQIPALDAKDQPPTLGNLFPTDGNALAVVRTVAEVLALVRPFFPNRLNGKIR